MTIDDGCEGRLRSPEEGPVPNNSEADFVDVEDIEEELEIVDDRAAQEGDATCMFDSVVGALEDILVDPGFGDIQTQFCRQHCGVFERSGENKLEYMQLFQDWTQLIESAVEERLQAALPSLSMADVLELISSREDELMGEVFELLESLSDFETFKDLMLSYKDERDGKGLLLDCRSMQVHSNEQEDGEARPDLDSSLEISTVPL